MKRAPATLRNYIVGFLLSLALTLASFFAATHLGIAAAVAVVALALLQLLVQMAFFLHIGEEDGAHWNLGMLGFVFAVLGILVGGTLWIMSNLAHLHMHSPTPTDLYEGGIVSPAHELH